MISKPFFPNPKVAFELVRMGWHPFRFDEGAVEKCRIFFENQWLDAAREVIGRFWGMNIYLGGLLVNMEALRSAAPWIETVEKVIEERVCPVGWTSALPETGAVLVSETGFYLMVDEEGIDYLGKSLRQMLDALILRIDGPPAPKRIAVLIEEHNGRVRGKN
jgi:hypothetical protein